MKSNAYVSIEAHVLECRLHHHNELSYSVALKSGTLGLIQEKINSFALPLNPLQTL